ncbi:MULTISPECIES: Crp/Fnr family transcriptional regulator [Clostridium]|uniref:Global nitrogen regulator n=2 Tax=Clostridium TaxID=1485 RepID=A0A151APW3_9CLOT|nr:MULTISPECIES: Crp/Fnr family transcriptional regulator [Clostridium]KYH29437.1 global nitrogen regulator [Clostridium colicanis DSM 13634]MBE6044027.1 Crp/Fnr family transcriptional regulator [Clostridium thermopalmarium]PRR70781.1 Global nitrogen regulator [Clostridium thermopalmarium DSM 5974]PVZ28705.1 CRP-like cAMP-binding protein [Clostridium thermopalmarium DSM 5974]
MEYIYNALKSCSLFSGFNEEEAISTLSNTNYKISSYKKGEIIALEDDPISSIGIVLEGTIEVQKNYPSGKTVTINRMEKGNVFGEAIIFSNKKTYPSTIVSSNATKILFIHENDILKLCSSNSTFLNNFMKVLSNRILTLSKILRDLSYQTIRQKISSFLLNEYKNKKSLTITLNGSRQEMADQFGTTRPSLSRELIKMKEDGLIDFDRKTITILDIEALEETLF